MNDLIQSDLQQVLKDWSEGRPVCTIAIGHPEHNVRQKKALEYTLRIIAFGMGSLAIDAGAPMSFQLFGMHLEDLAPSGLSKEEKVAAESLAWKAMRCGWNAAIAGYPDHQYLTLKKDADA